MKSNYQNRLEELRSLIQYSDFILIGAGAGLSTAAGLNYGGERFQKNFTDFIEKYNLTDMYSAGFYPFESEEEKWAYWSRHIKLNRFSNEAIELYKKLYLLVNTKDHFVLTTNADGLFYRSGFDSEKVFMVQGDYAKIQCSVSCHKKLYDDKELVLQMVEEQQDCKIPAGLVPKCPVCGSNMEVNVRKDSYFVEDEKWDKANEKYSAFLSKSKNKRILFLEFGVGYNTPTIIKFPFEKFTANNRLANLVRFNKEYPEINEINKHKTLVFSEDISKIIDDLNL